MLALSLGFLAYGRPALLRGIQPLRAASDALASLILKPELQLGRDFELRPSPRKGQVRPLSCLGCKMFRDVIIRTPVFDLSKGLFTLRRFERGEFIGRYTGLLRSRKEFMAGFQTGETSGDYLFLLGGSDIYIDADDPTQSNIARYINHSVLRKNCEARDLCLKFDFLGNDVTLPLAVVYIVATRRIETGQELYLDYGSTFWDSRARGLQRIIIDYF